MAIENIIITSDPSKNYQIRFIGKYNSTRGEDNKRILTGNFWIKVSSWATTGTRYNLSSTLDSKCIFSIKDLELGTVGDQGIDVSVNEKGVWKEIGSYSVQSTSDIPDIGVAEFHIKLKEQGATKFYTIEESIPYIWRGQQIYMGENYGYEVFIPQIYNSTDEKWYNYKAQIYTNGQWVDY